MAKKPKTAGAKAPAQKSPVRKDSANQKSKKTSTAAPSTQRMPTSKKKVSPPKQKVSGKAAKKKIAAPKVAPRWTATVICNDDAVRDLLDALELAKSNGRRVELIRASEWFYRQVLEHKQELDRLKSVRSPIKSTRDVTAPTIAVLALDDMSEMQVLPRVKYELKSPAGLSLTAAFIEMIRESNVRGGAARYVVPAAIYEALLASPQAKPASLNWIVVRAKTQQTRIVLDGHTVTLECLEPSAVSNARIPFIED